MQTLLTPGRNCWKISAASRASFLIDAADYYRAFAEAAEQAENQILITAWDIDGRIRLRPDRSTEDLRGFFIRLLNQKPHLRIFVLNWKYFVAYMKDRELLPSFDSPWNQHSRLHFEWDSSHPVGACHHQKVTVIDNKLAFVGGLDFTHERWDTSYHDPRDARRRNPDGDPYKPFHDTMVMVEGPIARDLATLVRRRWQRCAEAPDTDESCPKDLPEPPTSRWPDSIPTDLSDTSFAICRTEPKYGNRKEVREIEVLHQDMIRAARKFVYVESQYFTAERIAETIGERLQRRDSPEFIIVLPQGCTGWFEEASLGVLRARVIQKLRKADRYNRFHVYYPYIRGLAEDDYIKLHSKLMIVDDHYISIGSANLCNRSMAVDTECDLSLEASTGPGHRAIERFRTRLMAEHLDASRMTVHETFVRCGSLSRMISLLRRPARGLKEFDGEVSALTQALAIPIPVLDPIRPIL